MKFTQKQINAMQDIDFGVGAECFDKRTINGLMKRGLIEFVESTSMYGSDFYRFTDEGHTVWCNINPEYQG